MKNTKFNSGLPRWLSGKESTCNTGDLDLIPGSGRSPGEGNGNPLWYSCLENLMDRGTWWATYHKESDTTEQAHTHNKLSVNEYISNFLGKCPLGQ